MIIKQVRLSQQAKDQLSRLKGKTGIKNWNILCRWALCYSLSEKTIPNDAVPPADSNLEMIFPLPVIVTLKCPGIPSAENTMRYMRH